MQLRPRNDGLAAVGPPSNDEEAGSSGAPTVGDTREATLRTIEASKLLPMIPEGHSQAPNRCISLVKLGNYNIRPSSQNRWCDPDMLHSWKLAQTDGARCPIMAVSSAAL